MNMMAMTNNNCQQVQLMAMIVMLSSLAIVWGSSTSSSLQTISFISQRRVSAITPSSSLPALNLPSSPLVNKSIRTTKSILYPNVKPVLQLNMSTRQNEEETNGDEGARRRRRQAASSTSSSSSSMKYLLIGSQNGKRRTAVKTILRFLPSFQTKTSTSLKASNQDESSSTSTTVDSSKLISQVSTLEQENQILRQTIQQLEQENETLEKQKRIVIEQFEGENLLSWNGEESATVIVGNIENCTTATVADGIDDGTCPLEPTVSFQDALRDRAYWLIGLLALQSMSGFILARNEMLLQTHPVIVYFLTMLVGAGGNAGNQASVRVIRGIAIGTLNDQTQKQFLDREFKMAVCLSVLLSVAGFIRAAAFRTPIPETIAITSALALIVFSSICLGAVLPLGLKKLRVDPAHSSTTIQVIMDILGVVLTVIVSGLVLDSPFGQLLVSKLAGS